MTPRGKSYLRGFAGLAGMAVLVCGSIVRQGLAAEATDTSTPLRASVLHSPTAAAAEVDRMLSAEVLSQSPAKPVPLVDDSTFVRRISLDLIGELATPEEVTALSLDPAKDKRAKAVDRLLAQPQFGQNWARYWRDVILSRRSEPRALLGSTALTVFMTERLNQDAAWSSVAKEFITALGDVRDNGQTAIFLAQGGQTAETTAEIARIFMGIQIQCAQCHDHPSDKWKRSQFHELAAFFPRTALRPSMANGGRSFELVSVDRGGPVRRARGGSLEHYMPDLNDPSARGTLMQPVFFVTGQKLDEGQTDQDRRTTIAEWIVAPSNPWFARAMVNRLWAEFVGEGFYEPVDDMGPERKASAPKTLDYLATQFAANHYSVKWLCRTILGTQAYQRESRPRRTSVETPFASSCPQRLRADQLLNSLQVALGANPLAERGGGGRYGLGGPRAQFNGLFGYDPSLPRAEVSGSIPQALFMMNSPFLAAGIEANSQRTKLGALLSSEPKDERVVEELYLRCLAREPKPTELKTCLEHVRTASSRSEAFEDILWALINSTEFLHRK